ALGKGIQIPERRRDYVLARRNPEKPKLADVVRGPRPAGVDEAARAADVLGPHCRDLHVRYGFAELVEHPTSDHASARQRKVELLNHLAVEYVDRFSGLIWTRLSPLQADVAALLCGQGITAGADGCELVPAVRVGCGEAIL